MANKYVDVSLDKTAYVLSGIHAIGSATITITVAIPAGTPASGSIRVNGDALAYTSWTGSVFTLASVTTVEYADLSAVYTSLNDGTSEENAWFSLVEVLTNVQAYGSIIAGDLIYVRTHDGTSNCIESISASFTMTTPTSVSAPTQFIFDDGTVWGTGGVFRLDHGAVRYIVTFADYINMDCGGTDHRFEFYTSYSSNSLSQMAVFSIGVINGIHLNAPNSIGYNLCRLDASTLNNLKITVSLIRSTYYVISQGIDVASKLYNFQLEFLSTPTAEWAIFTQGTDGSSYEVIGGSINANASSGTYTYLLNSAAADAVNSTFIDFQTGELAGIFRTPGLAIQREASKVSMIGNGSPYNFHEESLSRVEFKQGENYPYLNATLPNPSNEGWSYKVSPWDTDKGFPYSLPPIVKNYNQTAAIKTLTLEFLLSTAFTNINTDDLFATFFYIDDTTGLQKTISTYKIGVALSTSIAPWSNTAYGAKSYNKYKIEVITPTAIKQGTKVIARVVSGIPEVAVDDFWFMDSDITIS